VENGGRWLSAAKLDDKIQALVHYWGAGYDWRIYGLRSPRS
jgi:hypothetical protein